MSSTNRFPKRMTAIEIARPGGPEVLVATSRPLPTPGPREVLVEVRAAGVNGPDVLQRKGVYDPPPGASDIPGLEIAGTVRAVGSEVQPLRRRRGGDGVDSRRRLRAVLRWPTSAPPCTCPTAWAWRKRRRCRKPS